MLLTFKESAPSTLAPGMNVRVVLHHTDDMQNDEGALSIPLRSVLQENGQSYVWIVGQDSCVHKKAVNTHRLQGENVLVIGLDGDEKIVKAGVHHVIENEKVVIL